MVKKIGTANRDILQGTNGIDELIGLGGNDTLYGKGGADLLKGGAGNDKLHAGRGADTVTLTIRDASGAVVAQTTGVIDAGNVDALPIW